MRQSWALLVLLGLVATASAESGWKESDGTDDVYFTVGWGAADTENAPLAPAYLAYVDLVSLEIVETETSLTFVLGNQAGFESAATDPNPTDRSITHTIHFLLPSG